MKRNISISIGYPQYRVGEEKAFELAAAAGADGVDFDTSSGRFDYRRADSVYARTDDEIVAWATDLREKAAALGLAIFQTHGRIKGFGEDPAENEVILENARRDLLVAKALGAPVAVIHGVSTYFIGTGISPERMHELNVEMFCRLLPYAERYGIKVATETFGDAEKGTVCDFFGSCREFIPNFDRIAEESGRGQYLTACMDVGHTNMAKRFHGNPPVGEFIRRLGNRLGVLHLHDNDGIDDKHGIPKTGTVDWKDVLTALDEVGYTGPYNLELNLATFGAPLMADTMSFGVKVMRQILNEHYGEETGR